MAVIGILILAGALAISLAVIAGMVLPQWRRIARLATGHPEPSFMPLHALAMAERRIAVRRWASMPMRAAVTRLRAAA